MVGLMFAPALSRAADDDAKARAEAEALFADGVALLDKGAFERACPLLEEVVRLQPKGVGAKFRLADCYEGAGQLESAHAMLAAAESAATVANQQQRAALARQRMAALSPRIAAAAESQKPVDLEAERPAPARASTAPAANPEKKRTAVVPPESSRDESASPAWPWVVGGIGLAALAAGAGFGIDGLIANAELHQKCPDFDACSSPDVPDLNDRKNRDLGLGIGLGATGAIMTAVGIGGLVGKDEDVNVAVVPSFEGIVIQGTF